MDTVICLGVLALFACLGLTNCYMYTPYIHPYPGGFGGAVGGFSGGYGGSSGFFGIIIYLFVFIFIAQLLFQNEQLSPGNGGHMSHQSGHGCGHLDC